MDTVQSKRAQGFCDDGSVEITVAPNAGACFGVVRAIRLGQQAISRAIATGQTVHALGPLIHNPKVVSEMEAAGIVTVQSPEEVSGGMALLRSHGVRKETEALLRSRGVQLVDATCPLVKKPQRIAQSVGEKGYFLVVVGDAKHPEVKGVLSYFGRPDYLVTYRPEEVEAIPAGVERVAVLAQTTIEIGVLEAVEARCRARFKDVILYNTICDATSIRQKEAEALAQGADVVIVVGGRNSSNTRKLEKICKQYQPDTFLIEELSELNGSWFHGKRKIGVTGGASTPQEYVDLVGDRIAEMIQQERRT